MLQDYKVIFIFAFQRWSRGPTVRGQGLKKNPKLRNDFLKTDRLDAKERTYGGGQGQIPRTQVF